ncbi:MAG: aldo/keto reductase [Clostridiales bacterium]|nr:aldo/keto reductase [Clostridiales bacterium]
MEYRRLGKSDIKISEVSLGCWVTGGTYWGGADDNESITAIQTMVDLGVNFIDTAEVYGNGHSEKVVGKALEGRRDKVYLSSKVWRSNMRYNDVKKACEGSLKRLKTDCIDVYFIHYPSNEGIPIEETMGAMLELQQEGKIRVIGLSNFSKEEMEEAMKVGRFDVIQPCYSLLWRFIEKDIIPYCIDNEVGIVNYSPLAQGILTGKFTPNTRFKEGDGRARAPLFQPGRFEKCLEVAEELKPIAEKYGKTQGQVAINWTTSQPGITSAIVGARNAVQARENVGAGGWRLEAEDLKNMEQISRRVTDDLPEFETFFTTRLKNK